jgi:hypothetical protein
LARFLKIDRGRVGVAVQHGVQQETKAWPVRFRAHYYFCRKVEKLDGWHAFATAFGRSRRSNYGRTVPKPSEALVWINSDGTARELTEADKKYVDSEYSPFDGARPYIKSHYSQRTALGEIKGYLLRAEIPNGVPIYPAPPES